MILSKTRITKALIKLRSCAGWYRLCYSQTPKDRFSHVETHILTNHPTVKATCMDLTEYALRNYILKMSRGNVPCHNASKIIVESLPKYALQNHVLLMKYVNFILMNVMLS